MKRTLIIIAAVALLLCTVCLIAYPHVSFYRGGKFYALRYTDSIDEFETELSADECYAYYEKEDISIHNYDIKKFLFFYVIKMDYIKGNYCDRQYHIAASYIEDLIARGEVTDNEWNIDLPKLLQGKTAVEGNKKYPGNEYDKAIYYLLDGKEEVVYIYEFEGMTVLQVGYSDEGPKYIAYK